jgi:hypothetical protein
MKAIIGGGADEPSISNMLTQGKEMMVKFGFQECSVKNLAMQVLGVDVEVQGGTVTGEILPASLAVGDLFALQHPNVSSVVLKGSTATPVTLTGTHYEMESLGFGTGRLKSEESTTRQPG